MKLSNTLFILLFIVFTGCSYISPRINSQDDYASIAAQSEILTESCNNDVVVANEIYKLRLHAKTANAFAQISPEEIKEASAILNKMVDELHSKYSLGEKVSEQYCKLKLNNIKNASQKILDTLMKIGD